MTRGRAEPDSKAVTFSVRLFERLLAAYPKEHRREYGPAMAQLFRDQCRDAWRNRRGWGLTVLWLRVLPDLVKTSILEHISSLKERKTMLERIGMLLHQRSAPRLAFIVVFATVFVLVVTTSTLITFLMPESYSSTARVRVSQAVSDAIQKTESHRPLGSYDPYFLKTQLEIIRSHAIRSKVVSDRELHKVWGKKYPGGDPFDNTDALALLMGQVELRPVNHTDLIEIRAFSDNPSEAAALANAVAESYREYRSNSIPLEIVDKAVPSLRPVRPNKPLNIALGIIGGTLLALVAGAGMAGLAAWLGRRSRGTGAPPGTGAVPPPDLPRAVGGGVRRPLK